MNDTHWPPNPKDINLHDGSWLKVEQAADLVRLSDRTLWRWRDKHNVAIKIGGRVWFNRDKILMQKDR